MKSSKDSNVFMLTETQVWLAEQQPSGFLVALWLDPDVAATLALPEGESANSLHVTLAYCGDAGEIDELTQARAITAVDNAVRYRDPVEGKIAGYGRFNASESSDGQDVFYASVDVPALSSLRQCIVDCLSEQGVPVSTNHGYTPHITLAYLDSGADNPVDSLADTPLKFAAVTIMAGEHRIDIPFWVTPYPETSISMSSKDELSEIPVDAPLGSDLVRPLYFGSFDKEWIPFLPKPGTYVHGQYGDMNLTTETYEEMLRNFNNHVFKQDLPIRATHTPADGGAIGWIKSGGMRLADDGSLEVKPEWNELGKGLVEDDRFKYVSAEFCTKWTNPVTQEVIPNVAVGLALVTRPHFKTDVLKPLSASEALAFAEATASEKESGIAGEGTEVDKEKVEESAEKLAEVVAPVVAAVAAAEVAKPVEAATQAISLNDLTQVVITAEQRATERRAFADLTARVELAERRATSAEASQAAMQRERRVEKYTAEVTGRSAENGVAWFGSIQENVGQLVSLAESHGDDSTQVRWTITQKRNEAQAIKNTRLFDPISLAQAEDGSSITAQVSMLSEQLLLANPNMTKDQAITRVYAENPELYTRSLTARH